jgi:hypothetical protein
MRALHAEPNAIKRDEIASPWLHTLTPRSTGKLRTHDGKNFLAAARFTKVTGRKGSASTFGRTRVVLLGIFPLHSRVVDAARHRHQILVGEFAAGHFFDVVVVTHDLLLFAGRKSIGTISPL